MTRREELELTAGGEHSDVAPTSTVADLSEQDNPLFVRLHKERPGPDRTADT